MEEGNERRKGDKEKIRGKEKKNVERSERKKNMKDGEKGGREK